MKVLALDFDGVIADSQMECLFVGFNTYLKFSPETKIFDGKKCTFDNFEDLKEKNPDVIEKYVKLRPFVADAFCYYVIIYSIEKDIQIDNQDQFNGLREELSSQYHDQFIEKFNKERFSLQDNESENWLNLEAPYEKIVAAIKELDKKCVFTVATNNRTRTVKKFLEKYQLSAKIITDASLSSNKVKHLEYISRELNINPDQIHFVDDQVKHFPNVLKMGVKCYLATWGYNTPEQQEQAREWGSVLLKEDNFFDVLNQD